MKLWAKVSSYVEADEDGTVRDRANAAAVDDAQDKVQRGQTEQDKREHAKLSKGQGSVLGLAQGRTRRHNAISTGVLR